jgi:hypothetical protein
MKCRIIFAPRFELLENEINDFIKDKDIYEIQFNFIHVPVCAILYEPRRKGRKKK